MSLSKKSVAWHEECLKNLESYYNTELIILEDKKKNVERMENEIKKRKAQIEYAKKSGITTYDDLEARMTKIKY